MNGVAGLYWQRLLRMGSDSWLMPVWRSIGDRFTGKGELDVWVVSTGT